MKSSKEKGKKMSAKINPNLPIVEDKFPLQGTIRFTSDFLKFLTESYNQHGGVFQHWLAANPAIMVLDVDAVDKIMWDEEVGTKAHPNYTMILKALGDTLLAKKETDEWKRRRIAIGQAFKPEGKAAEAVYQSLILDEINAMMDEWDQKGLTDGLTPVDIVKEFHTLALNIIMKLMFGRHVSKETLNTIPKAVDKITSYMTVSALMGDGLAEFLTKKPMDISTAKARAIMDQMLEIAQTTPPEEGRRYMIDVMADMLDAGKITHDQFVAEMFTVVSAGFETTANTIPWGILQIANTPEYQELLLQEAISISPLGQNIDSISIFDLPFASLFVKEVLRTFAGASYIGRALAQDLKIGNYVVPAGSLVNTFAGFMNRHPLVYEYPDLFNPYRWDKKYPRAAFLTFGGLRRCLGEVIAIMEVLASCVMVPHRYIVRPYKPGMPRQKFSTATTLDKSKKQHLVYLERRRSAA